MKKSTIDASVNFDDLVRYVRRQDDYFTIYLSSQTGCAQRCKMCFLTQTGQIKAEDLTGGQILSQAEKALAYYKTQPQAKRVNFAFMARGEPLTNPNVNDSLLRQLQGLAEQEQLFPRVLVSTIMSKDEDLVSRFPVSQPEIYYSIYSLKPKFREKWLPRALSPYGIKQHLQDYQESTKKFITLHWAFIKNENDDIRDVQYIVDWACGLRVNINIVRYNAFDDSSVEADESFIRSAVAYMKARLPESKIQLKERVGEDVYASCGMFENR